MFVISNPRRASYRGATLVTMIIFIGIVSTLLAGVTKFAVSHHALAHAESDYAAAINLAEAGANAEMAKLTRAIPPDQTPTTYSFGNGKYTVWITKRNSDGTESTPWSEPEDLYIYSTGVHDGASRTVKVSVKAYPIENDYAIYSTGSGITNASGSAPTIVGDVGTNGRLNFSGSPTINGEVVFNGPTAEWTNVNSGDYNVVDGPRALDYPTVSELANERWPMGGLTYLKYHSDNLRAIPPILNNTVTKSVILPAGDYYLERLSLSGSNGITFDNTRGPVNLWIGPEGGTGVNTFKGGSAAVPISVDPSKRPAIYVATRGTFLIEGDNVMNVLIYAHNEDAAGNVYGNVQFNGSPILQGQVVAGSLDIRGQPTIQWRENLMLPTTPGYYGYDTSWMELKKDLTGKWVPKTVTD